MSLDRMFAEYLADPPTGDEIKAAYAVEDGWIAATFKRIEDEQWWNQNGSRNAKFV
jgi:hypothetical protein